MTIKYDGLIKSYFLFILPISRYLPIDYFEVGTYICRFTIYFRSQNLKYKNLHLIFLEILQYTFKMIFLFSRPMEKILRSHIIILYIYIPRNINNDTFFNIYTTIIYNNRKCHTVAMA